MEDNTQVLTPSGEQTQKDPETISEVIESISKPKRKRIASAKGTKSKKKATTKLATEQKKEPTEDDLSALLENENLASLLDYLQTKKAKKSKISFSNIINFLLLIALFAAISYAHKAVNKSKEEPSSNATEVVAKVEQPQEKASTNKAENTRTTEVTEDKTISAFTTEKNEPTKTVKSSLRKQGKSYLYGQDPYTNGGPSDLDGETARKTYLSTTKTSKTTHKTMATTESYTPQPPAPPTGNWSDYNNPWNSGGPYDLDGPEVRSKYKKRGYSSR